MQKYIVDDLESLVEALPPHIQTPLRERADMSELLEVVLDLGRSPEARFPAARSCWLRRRSQRPTCCT